MGPNGRRLWDPMGETFGTQWAKFMGPNGQKAHALNSTLLQLAHWMLKHLCWFAALRNMIVTTRRSVTKLVHVLIICIACKQGVANMVHAISNFPWLPTQNSKDNSEQRADLHPRVAA
jgi:hypothetical protein